MFFLVAAMSKHSKWRTCSSNLPPLSAKPMQIIAHGAACSLSSFILLVRYAFGIERDDHDATTNHCNDLSKQTKNDLPQSSQPQLGLINCVFAIVMAGKSERTIYLIE